MPAAHCQKCPIGACLALQRCAVCHVPAAAVNFFWSAAECFAALDVLTSAERFVAQLVEHLAAQCSCGCYCLWKDVILRFCPVKALLPPSSMLVLKPFPLTYFHVISGVIFGHRALTVPFVLVTSFPPRWDCSVTKQKYLCLFMEFHSWKEFSHVMTFFCFSLPFLEDLFFPLSWEEVWGGFFFFFWYYWQPFNFEAVIFLYIKMLRAVCSQDQQCAPVYMLTDKITHPLLRGNRPSLKCLFMFYYSVKALMKCILQWKLLLLFVDQQTAKSAGILFIISNVYAYHAGTVV